MLYEVITGEQGTRDNTQVLTPSIITTTDLKTLQSILDVTPVAIQIVSPEGMFIDCNRKTLEMFDARVITSYSIHYTKLYD